MAVLFIGDDHELLRTEGDQFLLRLTATTTFDTRELFIDLISTIDGNIELERQSRTSNERQNQTCEHTPLDTRPDCPVSIRSTESDHEPRIRCDDNKG